MAADKQMEKLMSSFRKTSYFKWTRGGGCARIESGSMAPNGRKGLLYQPLWDGRSYGDVYG
jgi:hypothetical protein